MEDHERLDLLHKAKQDLENCIDKIQIALEGTSHALGADAYLIAQLNNWCSGGNPYDMDIQQYIDEIEKGEL